MAKAKKIVIKSYNIAHTISRFSEEFVSNILRNISEHYIKIKTHKTSLDGKEGVFYLAEYETSSFEGNPICGYQISLSTNGNNFTNVSIRGEEGVVNVIGEILEINA